jgi:hypothetical protein
MPVMQTRELLKSMGCLAAGRNIEIFLAERSVGTILGARWGLTGMEFIGQTAVN